jgi:hypothetical protein
MNKTTTWARRGRAFTPICRIISFTLVVRNFTSVSSVNPHYCIPRQAALKLSLSLDLFGASLLYQFTGSFSVSLARQDVERVAAGRNEFVVGGRRPSLLIGAMTIIATARSPSATTDKKLSQDYDIH